MLTPRKTSLSRRKTLSAEQLESRLLLTINLAQFQLTTVDSTSGGTLASEATDGIVSNDSSWLSQDNAANNHWVQVQLPVPYPVGSAHLYLGQDDTNAVSSFDVQYHNGSSWQLITSVVGDNSTDHNIVFPETITASRFRVRTTEDQLQVKEFVLLPPNGPAGYPLGTGVNLNLGSQLSPNSTSVDGTNFNINANDGYVSDDSRWSSDGSSGTHRLILRIPTSHEVGSVHLYSGETAADGTTINPLSDFSIQYSNNSGSSYTQIPGGTVSSGTMTGSSVSGNTSEALVIQFSTPVLANRIRISFNDASGQVREMLALPANSTATGAGYPIGTSVKFESPPSTQYDDYGDSWYRIVSRQNNRALTADETGTTQTVANTPIVERQYQVLYSYALDAYRIRAEDTGQALQVKDASLDAGASVVEGEFSAAPHQLWRLEPTDGGYFQVVNVWSGMVLHTGGDYPNVVTQQSFDTAANPANRVEWRMAFIDDYFKKGTASATVGSFGTSWSYNWGRGDFDDLSYDQFYVPMQFREGWPNFSTLHQKYSDWNDELKPSYLLGFNEPDREDQADMTVAKAVDLWPRLQVLDVPLVSPGNAHGATGQAWLEDFSDQTDALGYRTDYAATHWYSSPSVNSVLNYVDSTQTKSNGRDVWLTEFAVVDWSNGSGNWSEETNYNFILEFMYRAESKANLDKYALFLWTGAEPVTPWEKSNPRSDFFISNSGKSLTPFGKAYAGWDGETSVATETPYVIHNRDAYHRLQNDGGADVEKASIRIEDDSVQWIVQDAGNDEVFLTSAVDGRRVKLDGGNIVMSEPDATGWGVKWKIEQDQYGWQNIVHAGSGNYLRLNRVNDANGAPTSQTLDVVSAADSDSNKTDWWFVNPYEAAVHSDFGDAPESYPVTLADDGARHLVGGPTLGVAADTEADGTHSADGMFDDADGLDDEDGITFATAIFASPTAASTGFVDVQLANADATSNRLDAWVDFNRDGDWLDDGEQIFANFDLGTTNGTQSLSFVVPQDIGANVESGESYARFRLSTSGNKGVTGAAFDGEVEDHAVTINADTPQLTVAIASDSIVENGGLTQATVTRNTDTTNPLTVTLGSSDTGEATVATIVTIPAGETESAPFDITAVDDAIVDGLQTVTITATAPDYADGSDSLDVTDDDTAGLSLWIANDSISENGGATTATVSRNTDTTDALVVNLVSSDSGEATVATTVTIPAGQTTSAAFDIAAFDDAVVDGTQTVTITASVGDHADGTDTLEVTDDDTAGLSLLIATDSISENGGATTATVNRNTDTTDALVVTLTSSDTSEATVSTTVTIPAGQSVSAAFDITGVDDAVMDGTQTVTLTASVAGHADGMSTLDVIDDETAGIFLVIAAMSISENGGTTSATVSRNTETTDALIVTLATSDAGEANAPVTITIPAGQTTSAAFDVTAVDDVIADGTQTVTMTATAVGHADGADTVDVTDDETAGLSLVIAVGAVSENGGATTATVSRNTDTTEALIVTLTNSDAGEAIAPVTVTIPDGQSASDPFTISGVDDSVVDGTQTVTITATSAGHTDGTDTLDIDDDDTAALSLLINAASLEEDGGTTTATISRNTDTASALEVTLASSDTSEAVVATIVTIPAGQTTSVPFEIAAVDDFIVDGTQLVTITATTVGHAEATGTLDITDDDIAALSLTIVAAAMSENGGVTTATVSRNTATTNALTVMLATSDSDEAVVPVTVTIPAGQTESAPFELTAVDDFVVDDIQTVTVTAAATGHTDATDTVAVTDDDVAALSLAIVAVAISESGGATTATISRNTDTTNALTVTLATSDAAEATTLATVTIPAGQNQSAPFEITAVDDGVVDGTQTVTFAATVAGLADATGTLDVTDDDVAALTIVIAAASISENGGATTATVSRNTDTLNALTVSLISSDPEGSSVPVTVTIAAGQSTSDPFSVDAVDDAVVDGTQTVTINASADAHADGNDSLEVSDDDVATLTVSIAASEFSENGGSTTATVHRNTDTTDALTVVLLSGDSGEASVPATVTIAAGQSASDPFTISAVDDSIVDGLQTVVVTASAAAYADGTDSVAVADDDVAGFTMSSSTATVSESGTTTTVNVVLTAEPATGVVLTILSDDTSEVTVGPTTVTFTSADWNVAQAVTLTGVDDATVDGDQTSTITVSVDDANSDDTFDSLGDQTVVVTTTDEDLAAEFPFDVDDNNLHNTLTDGILTLRYLAGFGGDALVAGAIGANASRTSATEIAGWLAPHRHSTLDVDGDGEGRALTDGILVLRYLAGFQGDALIAGAVNFDGSRTTASTIEAWLSQFINGDGQASAVPANGAIAPPYVYVGLNNSTSTLDEQRYGVAVEFAAAEIYEEPVRLPLRLGSDKARESLPIPAKTTWQLDAVFSSPTQLNLGEQFRMPDGDLQGLSSRV